MTRLGTLKAKARALNPGVVSTSATVVPTALKRSRETTKTATGKANKKVKKEPTEDEGDNVDGSLGTQVNDGHDRAVTPPATPGNNASNTPPKAAKLTTPSPKAGNGARNDHVQPKRCSPRDSAKPDYRKLDDPFVYMEGGLGQEGTNVYGSGTDSQGIDSIDIDQDFAAEEGSTQA